MAKETADIRANPGRIPAHISQCILPCGGKKGMKTMKRIPALMLSLMLLVCCACAAAEGGEWICPSCGAAATGNFCSNCGAMRSEAGAGAGGEGTVRLDLKISFEKNAYFSRYNVRVYLDDEYVTTMGHGTDYAGTVHVAPGKHIITFQEDDSSYPSTGSTIVTVNEPTLYECTIHAKRNVVQITGEQALAISENSAAPGEKETMRLDGDVRLRICVDFRKNGMFSQYDVDLYMDNDYVATLPHGRNYEGVLLVEAGSHLITFCKSGDQGVRGTCEFSITDDATLSCGIHAQRNKVEVTNARLIY